MAKGGFGIAKMLRRWLVKKHVFIFSLRKKLYGFEYANIYASRVDKQSLKMILIKNGAKIGSNCDIESGQTFHNCQNYNKLIIGDNCHIGKNCFFDLMETIQIKDNVTVSMECKFLTHMDLGASELKGKYPTDQQPIRIQSNSYIGAAAVILMGCQVGEHSMVAAGSLVHKNIPANQVFGGVPARSIHQDRVKD
jgi:acetyltransferase-like isoleucine patch superfamily enzyme